MSMSGSSDGLTQEVLEGVYVEVGIYLSWLMMDSTLSTMIASYNLVNCSHENKNKFMLT